MYDPLMVSVEEAARAKAQPQQRLHLEVVTAKSLKREGALDRSSNPSLRGLLLGWVIDKEQAHLKRETPERRFFLVWKKAQSLNETRLPKRLPDDKVKAIAQTVTHAATDGTANLKYRAHYKEDILRHRDPEKYRAEQSIAGKYSGKARRAKNHKRDAWVIAAAKVGMPKVEIARQDGRARSVIYYILNRQNEPVSAGVTPQP